VTQTRRHDAIALALLAALITLAFADVLLGTKALYYRDVTLYAHPAKSVLRDVVLSGEFPYWNRALSAGQPLAANPAHEVFYPLTWLILFPNFNRGFQLFILVHLYLAAFATYALLRSMRLAAPAAFLGALSFACGGLFLSYLNLLPILASAAWLPAVCLFARRFLMHRARRDFALATVCFAMQVVIGEPTTLLQTGIVLGLYALFRHGVRGVAFVGLLSLAALLAGAVQALPAFDHAGDSVRARGFSYELVTEWSMPPLRIAELLHRDVVEGRSALYGTRGGPFVASIYPGLAITLLALGGMILRVRGWPLALTIVAVSVLLAVGAHTPLWRGLYDLGLARSLRFPEKFILMAVFAISVFGARVLDVLLPRIPRAALAIAMLLVVADLGRSVTRLAPRIDGSYFQRPHLAQLLPPNRGEYRLYHHAAWHASRPEVQPYFAMREDVEWVYRNAMMPMVPHAYGVQTAIDVDYDLTALQPTADFTEAARALARWRRDWADVAASMSNVWYRTAFNVPDEAFAAARGQLRDVQPVQLLPFQQYPRYSFAETVESIRGRDDFVRKLASGRFGKRTAFVSGAAFAPAAGRVQRVRETANTARVDVETAGRAFLVISVTPHKYWRVTVDGAEVPAMVTNIGYQGIVVPGAGRHVVEMRYRNPLVPAGAAISLVTLLALSLFTRRREPAAAVP
jgi:hypothetical protein